MTIHISTQTKHEHDYMINKTRYFILFLCREFTLKKPRNASNLRFKIQEIQLTFAGKPTNNLLV